MACSATPKGNFLPAHLVKNVINNPMPLNNKYIYIVEKYVWQCACPVGRAQPGKDLTSAPYQRPISNHQYFNFMIDGSEYKTANFLMG